MNIDRDFWKRFNGKEFTRKQNVAVFFDQAVTNTFPQRIYHECAQTTGPGC